MHLIRIKYVTKTANDHEHITQLGTDNVTFTLEQVIYLIESGNSGFYTDEAGKRATIEVRQGTLRKYVQTRADGALQNNLLSLPPCVKAA